MDSTEPPQLKFLHSESTLNRAKLDKFRRLSADELKTSLAPGQPGSLKVRLDGPFWMAIIGFLSSWNGVRTFIVVHESPDRGVPASTRAALSLLGKMAVKLELGKNVAVHCRQSVGRSGLVAAGLLVASGMSADNAIDVVSAARGQIIPETSAQLQWIKHLPSGQLALAP